MLCQKMWMIIQEMIELIAFKHHNLTEGAMIMSKYLTMFWFYHVALTWNL